MHACSKSNLFFSKSHVLVFNIRRRGKIDLLPFKPSPTTLPLALFFLLQILQVTGMCDPTREKGKDQATKYKEEKRPKMRRFVRLCWWVRGVQLWQRSWLGAAGWRRPPPGTQETPRSTMAVTNRPPCLPPPRGLREHIG